MPICKNTINFQVISVDKHKFMLINAHKLHKFMSSLDQYWKYNIAAVDAV